MHTMECGDVTMIHNGDWSGTATLRWKEGGADHEARVPGSVILSVVRGVVSSRFESRADELADALLKE